LALQYSARAVESLEEIWGWNSDRYGITHANQYVEFLLAETEKLVAKGLAGRQVPDRPNYRYVAIRRRAKGHGHVVVYKVSGNDIIVLDYFHTSQD